MPQLPEPFDNLVSHAQETHVVVVGGGIAGLVAALECAKVGMPVTVLEAAPHLGGTIRAAEVGGLRVDVGASSWAGSSAAMTALVAELELTTRVVAPQNDRTWIAGLPKGAAAPVPEDSVLGIPANPWDEGVRRFIGWNGAWRAYLDRLRPPLTIGTERNLGKLVRTRMGEAVHDLMVAPLSCGRFGVPPEEVDVAVARPGLSSALTRTGSLGAAVGELRAQSSGAPAVQSLDGGMTVLTESLRARLEQLGVRLVTGARVTGIERVDERWHVAVADGDEPAQPVQADIVFVATAAADAVRLLAPHVAALRDLPADAAITREVVTLVVDAPDLDAAPRGAAVYPVPGTLEASGLVHQTARWAWLARAAGPGRHVLSVAADSADAQGTTGDSDADAVERARDAASALLGVRVDAAAVRGSHRARFALARPASAIGQPESAAAARAAIDTQPGLAAVGAWLSGSGLAQVVDDALEESERVRRRALWGESAGV